ncbi:Secreted cathepsin L 1 [Fasciola hepatica]|uniref:Secreted cathepsin L 1 n=1 Tax=Fasciola hepatica TaxID=6192 RepID=A0A2H1BTA3_FASHE|nr:Secreted cathepsin L 1 [Fasciola hepatica]
MPRSSELLSHGIPYKANKRAVPASIDWRESGYVTEVKDQGQCGSCWAFSTTGTMEGQYMKNERVDTSFSEQQLVDCSRPWGNNGCGGGFMENAYNYLRQFGLESESSYPYQAVEDSCQCDRQLGVAKVTGYYTVHSGNELELQSLVGAEGPAAVAVAVDSDFMMYRGGIYQSEICSLLRLNHAVLTVGYGSQDDTDYWIVKNSWGTCWGEYGYIRLVRNRGNMCGIASLASVPIVARFP